MANQFFTPTTFSCLARLGHRLAKDALAKFDDLPLTAPNVRPQKDFETDAVVVVKKSVRKRSLGDNTYVLRPGLRGTILEINKQDGDALVDWEDPDIGKRWLS